PAQDVVAARGGVVGATGRGRDVHFRRRYARDEGVDSDWPELGARLVVEPVGVTRDVGTDGVTRGCVRNIGDELTCRAAPRVDVVRKVVSLGGVDWLLLGDSKTVALNPLARQLAVPRLLQNRFEPRTELMAAVGVALTCRREDSGCAGRYAGRYAAQHSRKGLT